MRDVEKDERDEFKDWIILPNAYVGFMSNENSIGSSRSNDRSL